MRAKFNEKADAFLIERRRAAFSPDLKLGYPLPKIEMILFKALVLFIQLFVLLVCVQISYGATYFSGTISGDVQWNMENSPYIIDGDVIVPYGSSLTIEPGTTIIFKEINEYEPGGYSYRAELIVRGDLSIYGERHNPVILKGEEGCSIGDWQGIVIESSYVHISYAKIKDAQKGIDILSGAPTIKNSVIERCFRGINIENDAMPSVERNLIQNSNYGIYWLGEGSAYGNRILYNSYGIYVSQNALANISYNEISANTFGVLVNNAESHITNNDFNVEINSYGIYIQQGLVGVINYNNFYYDDDLEYDPSRELWFVSNDSPKNIDATYNYWDTINEILIEGYIYDGNNRQGLGIVIYDPFLTTPNKQTFNWFIEGEDDFPGDPNSGDSEEDYPEDGDIYHTFGQGKSLVSIPALELSNQSSFTLMDEGATFYLWVDEQYYKVEYIKLSEYEGGTGFWIDTSQPLVVDIPGSYGEFEEDIHLSLSPGWNVIGTPVKESFDVFTDLFIKYDEKEIELKEAAIRGLVEGIWSYNNGAHELIYNMLPWKGYWIKAHVGCELVFKKH